MSFAKVIELTADSTESFEAAVREGVRKASDSLDDVRAAWVENQEVLVEGGRVKAYRVHLKITFVLK